MKRWLTSMLVVLFMVFPAIAGEEKKDDGQAVAEDAAKKVDDGEKESPILRLAEMRLDEYVVPARMINLPIPGKTRTVQDILDQFEKWTEDDKIGGVLLDVGYLSLTLPDIQELRNAVERFKKSGKKVVAFLNAGGQSAYLLACAADEIAVAPTGGVMIPGTGTVFPFMKGYYQMLGVDFEVITAGKFKYGGFVNKRQPDEHFYTEFNAIFDGWYGDVKQMIAQGRNLSLDQVKEAIDIALFDANQAQQRGLVDTLAYYDEYREQILRREKMKRHRDDDRGMADVNSIQDLVELVNDAMQEAAEAHKAVGPKIAVLHARGPIIDLNLGPAFASTLICRDDFGEVVDELRKNKSIKAVVMRIDSPGGSGYASDVIWKKLRQLDEEKPLVVSQGFVAASGGYYLSCPARRIFAQPTTITGSIGVIGIIPCMWSRYNRMDYELVDLPRGERSLLGAAHRELSKEDRAFIQNYMDDFYSIFIDRVAVTRKMPASEVRKIAEGRIYTGRDALKIGLVDELGGLAEAIDAARAMANIPPSAELKIVHYPRAGSLGEIFESLAGTSSVSQVMEAFSKGVSAARPVTFDQQLTLFSQRLQPLCWMAMPDISLSGNTPQLQLPIPGLPMNSANPFEQLPVLGN
ncbi:MAG: signal peptide peptidase SppA [Planctomycetes bacterium]|nr:signal peptide peptidase SppA [Planctomycetota bacterium]